MRDRTIIIHQGQPLDEFFAGYEDRNYSWINMFKFLNKSKVKLINGEVSNKGSFFKPDKQAIVKLHIPIEKELSQQFKIHDGSFTFFSIINPITNKKCINYLEPLLDGYIKQYSFGSLPVGTKIEKFNIIIELTRRNKNNQIYHLHFPFTYVLEKPFIVS